MAEIVVCLATFLVLTAGLAFTLYEMPRLAELAKRKRALAIPRSLILIRNPAARSPVIHQVGYNRTAQDAAIGLRVSTERIARLTVQLESMAEKAARLSEENCSRARALDMALTDKAELQRELDNTRAQLQSATRDLDRARHDGNQAARAVGR